MSFFGVCIFFLVVLRQTESVGFETNCGGGKIVEKAPLPVKSRNKTRYIKARVYRLEHDVFFDAEQRLFCDGNGVIEKLSPAMSVLLEHFLKASDHTLTKYEIYQIMGKDLEEYSLDSFYKMIERFRKKLKQFSSVTLHSDGNGAYRLILPLDPTDMN